MPQPPDPLEAQVQARRARLAGQGLPQGSGRLWGLALSGGGIRSATFCFGLLRALARQGLLLRFDLLSTVSGGGYIGAMLGRLFSRAASAADVLAVADAVKHADSRWFTWWLRANGRYLIPRGAKDRSFAIAAFVRNLIGVHFELGLMAMLMGTLLALIDLAGWALLVELGYGQQGFTFSAARYLSPWLPVIWLLLPLVGLAGVLAGLAYWSVPWLTATGRIEVKAFAPYWLGAIALLAGGLWVHARQPWPQTDIGQLQRGLLWAVGCSLLAAWVLALPLCARVLQVTPAALSTAQRADIARSRLTKWLANALRTAALLVLLGAVDRAAWYLAFEYEAIASTGVLLGVAAALVRALLPAISSLMPGSGAIGGILLVGRLFGYALTFLLGAWWVALVYRAGLGALFQRGPDFGDALGVLLTIGLPVLGYLWLSGRNLDFLNLSSLHVFYKARLIRSYLGAANARRFGQPGALGALGVVPPHMPSAPPGVSIGELQADDDLAMADYLPQRHGGPVHLVNVCINQTRDPRGGLFNQDRRGLPLTIASGGLMQVAREGWRPLAGRGGLTLGSWMAISGAAVAPGLGSLTRGGISALATFAGLRLGFWWDKATREGLATRASPVTAKSVGLLRETFGIFRGTERPDWFLTDGGHLENTGAYALLAERAELIVLADCGADPRYAFGDLENLVRKARIDLQAEVLFQRPLLPPGPAAPPPPGRFRRAAPHGERLRDWPEPMKAFGSLNDLASSTSTACLAFATVRYNGGRPGRGILIVVKPNVCDGLPVDLVNFKAENPEFPQQSTADQFFSEAQWESYFQLGQFLGGKLSREFIERLIERPEDYFEKDDRSPFDTAAAARQAGDAQAAAAARPASRLPARIGSTTVRTTLGLGAAATIGVSAWQAIDSLRTSAVKQAADDRAALAELSALWARPLPSATPATPGAGAAAAGALAAAIVRTADTLCPGHEAGWFQRSRLAQRVLEDAVAECKRLPQPLPPPCDALLDAVELRRPEAVQSCLKPISHASVAVPLPRYWVYDYAGDALYAQAHPCDAAAAARAGAAVPEACVARDVAAARAGAPSLVAQAPSPSPPSVSPAAAPPRATVTAPPPALPPAPSPAAPPAGPLLGPPRASVASAPASTPEVPRTPVVQGASECEGHTVLLQIYGPAQADAADAYRERWRALGAKVPGVEDVLATARNAGRTRPATIDRTAVRYHTKDALPCARLLGPSLGLGGWVVEPLSSQYPATPGVIEVWVSPAQAPLPSPDPPGAAYREQILRLTGSDRRQASAELLARPAAEQPAVVRALVEALLDDDEPLSFRRNLYVAMTLARMPEGWPGSAADRARLQALTQSRHYRDATFKRWVDAALQRQRGA